MIAEIANDAEPPTNKSAGLDTDDSRVIVVVVDIDVDLTVLKETPMKHIARFVTTWRVELILLAMVLSAVTTTRAQAIGATSCSEVPVLSYEPQVNLCMGNASDCYMCVVWLAE